MYKIINNIFFGVVGVIALLLIATIFPITGNYKLYVVESGSMAPAIKTGSMVAVKPVKEYRIGDVITFNSADKKKSPTSHRIQEIKNDNGRLSYVVKGDANNAPDSGEVAASAIIGKIIFSLPYIGYGVATVKTPWGFGLIIGLPALIIIVDEMKKLFLEIKRIWWKKKSKGKNKSAIHVIDLK